MFGKRLFAAYEYVLFLNNHFSGYFENNLKVVQKLYLDVHQVVQQNFQNTEFLQVASDCIYYYNCLYDNLHSVNKLITGY